MVVCASLGCGTVPGGSAPATVLNEAASARSDRARTSDFAEVEGEAIRWMSAADPRLAARANATASDQVLNRIGTEAVLAEDTTALIRGNSLDLFAFRARAQALERAASTLAWYREPLPEEAPVGRRAGEA